MAVGLAVVGVGVEHAGGVEALSALRSSVGAGPLDAGGVAQLGVAHPAVVTPPAGAAPLPRLERRFRVVPLDQRLAIPVAESHAARVVEEYLEVGLRPARRLHHLFTQM